MNKDIALPIKLTAFRVQQSIGEFYIASVNPRILMAISQADVRELVEDGKDEFIGLQRRTSKKRINEISNYLSSIDATFPTSIILAVDERCVEITYNEDCKTYEITLSTYESDEGDAIGIDEIAKVLDGQHRIEALRQAIEKLEAADNAFDVNVSLFVGADLATQANIFSVVNLAQTKVNHSLVYDLLSYAKIRSPEKTCHEIAVALNSSERSPFYGKIKRLGVATPGAKNESLSQATFVRGLVSMISSDTATDRDKLSRNESLNAEKFLDNDKLILRYEFALKKDEVILDQVWEYFEVVSERWPEAWNALPAEGLILNKTTGYIALARFMRDAILAGRKASGKRFVERKFFAELFASSELNTEDFQTGKFKPGSSGSAELYREFLKLLA